MRTISRLCSFRCNMSIVYLTQVRWSTGLSKFIFIRHSGRKSIHEWHFLLVSVGFLVPKET